VKVQGGLGGAEVSSTMRSNMSETTFASLSIHANTKRAIAEVLGYSHMSAVQAASLPAAIEGFDILARARTGTGKTMAFLIPGIEMLLRGGAARMGSISMLVVSPTRELAIQIAEEAKKLLTFHTFAVQHVIGNTPIGGEQKRLAENRCDILVGTPGRLIDHIERGTVRLGQSKSINLVNMLSKMSYLVLDEADRLLDMGFVNEIKKILAALPKERNTFLFSATVPKEIQGVASIALRKDHMRFIDTIGEDAESTVAAVQQQWAVCSMEDFYATTLMILQQHCQVVDFKIIVFCCTARQTQHMAETFLALGLPALQIHSRMSQPARSKASEAFRKGTSLVLFSSDVTARGLDYPDVTLVLQAGVPSNREQYIHRLGRTGRAGKLGCGVMLLCDFESYFVKDLKDLPLQSIGAVQANPDAVVAINAALKQVDIKLGEMCYSAWLGFYNSQRGVRWSKPELVQHANKWAKVIGLAKQPVLEKKTVGKMGLKGIPGLLVQ